MKLVKALQDAHAGELAAYYAYQGHWESLKDPSERAALQEIQQDELEHIIFLSHYLNKMGFKPSPIKDFVWTTIGKTIGALCHVTGWYLPMRVAGIMERIGTKSYIEISAIARAEGHEILAKKLLDMAEVEKRHENTFANFSVRK